MLYTLKINWSYILYVTVKRQDSIVDRVTRLWVGKSRFDCCRVKNCCLPKHTDRQWGFSSFLFSGQQGFFPRDKLASVWSLPLTSAPKVKNSWSYTSVPQYTFMACMRTALLTFCNGLVRKNVCSVLKQCCLFFLELQIILNSTSYLVNACFSTVIL